MAKQGKKQVGGDISDEFKAAPVSEWKKKSKLRGQELVLPSGLTCVSGRVNLEVFLKTGRIPNSLRPMIDRAMQGKEISQEEVLGELAGEDFANKLLDGDEEALKTFNDLMTMVDAVVVDVMIDPKVIPAPETEEDRSDTILHVDEIDDEDRMFIFNYAVGGTRNLEPFREGQASNVERILAQQGSGGGAE